MIILNTFFCVSTLLTTYSIPNILQEIQECVNYHVNLAALLSAPTTFRLLNNPGISAGSQEFDIATKGEEMIHADVNNAINIMSKVRPSGCTPLTEHIWEIHSTISAMKSSLEAQGKKVVVVLATDGLPTNNLGLSNNDTKDLFVQSLRALEGLPVWLVIRLSTDEENVVVSTVAIFGIFEFSSVFVKII